MSFKDQDQDQNQGDKLTFKVGEREYDAESAANKINNADEHIAKLEAENAAFRQQMEQGDKIQEALEFIKSQQQSSNAENVQQEQNTTGLSEEQIAAITQSKMEEYLASQDAQNQQKAAERLEKETYKQTAQALVEIYGEDVDKAVGEKAAELGVQPDELFNMAKSPASAKLLLETMKPAQRSSDNYPSGGYNTNSAYSQDEEPLITIPEGDRVTSSSIVDSLRKHGATY